MIPSTTYDITQRFCACVRHIISEGETTTDLATNLGADRPNLLRLLRDPNRNKPQLSWISALCVRYHISAMWLLTGEYELSPSGLLTDEDINTKQFQYI